jgi:hypothetical protein
LEIAVIFSPTTYLKTNKTAYLYEIGGFYADFCRSSSEMMINDDQGKI